MERFYAMAQVQATLFVYLAVGYTARKYGLITKKSREGITNLLVSILLPCMVFSSFHQEVTSQQLKSAVWVLLISFIIGAVSWLVGWLLFHRYPEKRAAVLRYGTLVPNSGFAGLPVIQSAYGTAGLLLASMFIIPNRIFMWSAGVSLFRRGEKCDWVRSVLLNPGIIAVFLGLVRMLFQIPLPTFVDTAIASMGGCTTAISIIVVGSILADVDWRTIFNRDAFLLAAVRLVLIPVCTLVVLKALQFNELGTAVAVVLTGMPIGTTTAILGEKYGADAGFASQCVFVTTLLSLITMPMLSIFL